ncbi:hypothetical protein [Vagococcus carniphilus]|uniref:Uncharacterized protein n=1 Tax=Vagococcus carniphilus TaxID=218144 RepID=A0A430AQ83_9ENTE|nr:hypothetical protein [Vagococcus carniphilus]QNN72545.1 hypothetical protein H9L18_11875 [Vagococcus carniphilus]RSU10215.1 hypothetical protein CBF28_14060 [Vagococcus carniphilus]
MESYELIFNNISPKEISVLLKWINFKEKNVLSSHFYINNKDVKFESIDSLEIYFNKQNTGNILVKDIYIGATISKAIIVISFDDLDGNLTINFSEKDMTILNDLVLADICSNILSIMTNLNNATIFFGYEPAEDNDMTLFSLNKNNLV